ncbi:VOC family protein [Jatrophihabitans sp. YIM 134969]
MPHTYPQGVPSWSGLKAPYPEAAKKFYGGLFGWIFETVTPPGAPPYAIARLDGADAAGLDAGEARWSTYVAVDDVEASAAAVTAAGGTVTSGPDDTGPAGRSASCTDPTGMPFRPWQAGLRLGAQVTNVPNAWNFSNLHAADPALEFYEAVFGWRRLGGDDGLMLQVPGHGEHLRTTVDPDILERQANAPDGFEDVVAAVQGPNADGGQRWNVMITVVDRDDTAARAEGLGADVLGRAEDGWTRTALLRDPQGAVFTVSQSAPPDDF